MYWYCFENRNDDGGDGGNGGRTPVLVLCIGIDLNFYMIVEVMTVVLVVPLYWYYVLVLVCDWI